MMPYSELASGIHAIPVAPHDSRFFHLLGEVSEEENEAGRGLMTAIVVHKEGDMQPGPGFFDLAKAVGRDVTDIERCWVEERVHAAWA
jgi:hypothetical protein